MTQSNGYVKRTRFKVAQVSIILSSILTAIGIIIGMHLNVPTLISAAITAGITGITTISVAYIGGDSFRPSFPEQDNDIVIYQDNKKNSKDDLQENIENYKSPI